MNEWFQSCLHSFDKYIGGNLRAGLDQQSRTKRTLCSEAKSVSSVMVVQAAALLHGNPKLGLLLVLLKSHLGYLDERNLESLHCALTDRVLTDNLGRGT